VPTGFTVNDARISCALPAHPKCKKLEKRLGDAGPWALVRLFLWCAQNRSDGDLAGMSDEDIELAIDWAGEQDALVATLVAIGFLDGEPRQRRIHDWHEHNPYAAGAKARQEQARKAGLISRYGEEKGRSMFHADQARRRQGANSESTGSPTGSAPHVSAPSTPLPSPSLQKLPTTSGRETPDPIFGTCLAFLMNKGMKEPNARSFLGLMRKDVGDLVTMVLVTEAEREDVSKPEAWLRAAIEKRKKVTTQAKSTGVVIGPQPYELGFGVKAA